MTEPDLSSPSTDPRDPHEFDPDFHIVGTLWCIRGVATGFDVTFESAPASGGTVNESESEIVDAFKGANGQWLVLKYKDRSAPRGYRVTVDGAGCTESCPSEWVIATPDVIPLPLPECQPLTEAWDYPDATEMVLKWQFVQDDGGLYEWALGGCSVNRDPGDPSADPPEPDVIASRTYEDLSGGLNHGVMYTEPDGTAGYGDDDERLLRSPGPQVGVHGRGWGHQTPTHGGLAATEDGTSNGVIAVEQEPATGTHDQSDFYSTEKFSVSAWYRPWLWSAMPDQALFGRWNGTSGFHWKLIVDAGEEYVVGVHGGFTVRFPYNWSGHEVSEYSGTAAADAFLASSWHFFCATYGEAGAPLTVYVGRFDTGHLDKLCPDLTDTGSTISSAESAPQATEITDDSAQWVLGATRQDASDGASCGEPSVATARMHYDDHRFYRRKLTDREVRGLFYNPGR